jgi:raffinose/stachyose/melibiose transport system substrate-binding protein
VLVSETQKLITGSAEPKEYLDALQSAYDEGATQE